MGALCWLWLLGAQPTWASSPAEPAHRLAQAYQAIRDEDWGTAEETLQQALPAPWGGHASALQGIVYLNSDRAVDAVQALQASLANPLVRPPLRNTVQLHLGMALLSIEDGDGAWETLLDLLESGRHSARAKLPAPDGVDPGAIRWHLAQVAIAQGRPNEAQRQWETLWTHNPTSQFSTQAKLALDEADTPINPKTQSGLDLITSRIRSLEKLYRTKEALALREQLPSEHRLREAHRFAGAVFKAKDYVRAATLLNALPQRSDDESILLALAHVRSGDPEASVRTYKQLSKKMGSVAELAQYKLGYMAWDQGQWSHAIEEFSAYLSRYPTGKHGDTALWFSAMAQMRLGADAQARNTLGRLQENYPNTSLQVGAAYWVARLQPNPDERRRQLSTLIERAPKTGYAWFASQALGRSIPPKTLNTTQPPASLFDDKDWSTGIALSKAGLETWARPHLESLIPQAKQAGRPHRLALAGALIDAGSYQAAKRMAQPWCGSPAKTTDPMLIVSCWPQPSRKVVMELAEGAGLPAHLPFAIMTAESALDPGVTSPAGARGLMQLMPKLAQILHEERWPDVPFHADVLFRSSTNAMLGTTELTRLAAQFSGAGIDPSLPLVIAGYNGGSEAVNRWIDGWSTTPKADEWAEFIGYSETRKYVRRVLGYLQTYRLAYGDTQPAQAPSSKTQDSSASGSPGQE
jgi:TolA-binding protein